MIKGYTDLEQSKKLAEILPIDSSDMSYHHFVPDLLPEGYCVSFDKVEYKTDIPCWSLSALLEILPSELELPDMYGGTIKYEIRIRKYSHTNELDLYQIAYATNQGLSKSWHDMVNTSEQEDLLDVVFEMVCYLKENKMI